MTMKYKMFKDSIIKSQSAVVEKFWRDSLRRKYPEVVVYGPVESSKTFEAVLFAHYMCATVPRFQCVLLRKEKTTIYSTVFQSLKQHILPYGLIECRENLIQPYGGQNTPQWLDYKETGARMWFLGEDDKYGKALGTEWDLALYSQCEKASAEFWMELTGRCTGRSDNWIPKGHTKPRGLLIGECNPASSKHFLRNRWKEGRTHMYKFLHVDNPKMFYDGEYTEYGNEVIPEIKNKFTGHLLDRLYYGHWVGVAGAVYGREYDPKVHDVEENFILSQIQDDWLWTLSMDFGFNNPFAAALFVGPPDRSVLYCYKEVYMSHLDPDDLKEKAHDLRAYAPRKKRLRWTVADHKPETHEALRKIGFPMRKAKKEVLAGIETVKQYLHQKKVFFNKDSLIHDPDERMVSQGKPTRSVDEFEVYAYKPEDKQTGSPKDEEPMPENNHFCDLLRYELVEWDQKPQEYIPFNIAVPMPEVTGF